MKFRVYTAQGEETEEKELEVPVFKGDKGLQTLKDVIVAYQANCRQGTASAKTRAAVVGSGKKIYRQKGTGRARHGDRQSPIFVGGGIAHPPKPRDWTKRINKKVRKMALKRAVFDRVNAGDVSLIERFEINSPKAKDFNERFSKIFPSGSVLLVGLEFSDHALLASRNLKRFHIINGQSVNAWDFIRFDKVLVSEGAFNIILKRVSYSKVPSP